MVETAKVTRNVFLGRTARKTAFLSLFETSYSGVSIQEQVEYRDRLVLGME